MAAIAGVSLTTPRLLANASPDSPKTPIIKSPWLKMMPTRVGSGRMYVRPTAATPEGLSEKVAESIENAQEACGENPESGECKAAWDTVEELSAAASHAKDKKKDSDPLETYCKDNPETGECRTYDN